MPPFKKKVFTEPVISNHCNDLERDWYVSFRYKHIGCIHKLKRREGVNRIKDLQQRLVAISELRDELSFDLKHGWNPFVDPKREGDYNPYLNSEIRTSKNVQKTKKQIKDELFKKYYTKGM